MNLQHDKLFESAQFYFEKGFVPIPLSRPDIPRSPENTKAHIKELEEKSGRKIRIGKEPLPKEYQLYTHENFPQIAEQNHLWQAFTTTAGNIGMLVGAENIIVLDCDSIPVFDKFYPANKEILKDTPMVSTGRGYHIYVRVEKDEEAYSCDLLYDGESFGELIGKTKTGGCKMICVPPSIHITDKEYKWVHELDKSKVVTIASLSELGLENAKKNTSAPKRKREKVQKLTVSVLENCTTTTHEAVSRHELRVMSFQSIEKRNHYINKNIDKAVKTIANATEGTRNSSLSSCAGFVFRLIDDNDVDKMNLVKTRLISAGVKCGLSEAEIISTLESAISYAQSKKVEFIVDDGLSELNEMWSVVTSNYSFRYNSVKGMIEWKSKDCDEFKELTDRDANTIRFALMEFGVTMNAGEFMNILTSDFVPEYNYFKEYFDTLDKNNAEGGILRLANTVEVADGQEDIWEEYLKRWMIASVATMLEAGTNHGCITFVGEQGVGKSKWLNRLSLGKQYGYCGAINPSDKDSKILISEMGLLNLDELEGSTYSDWAYIKSLMTIEGNVKVRRPYAKRVESLSRHASFCASVNDSEILSDTSGSRRWWIVEVKEIDYKYDLQIVKTAWAEAYNLFMSEEKYWFDGDEITEINNRNDDLFSFHSAEEEAVMSYFCLPESDTDVIEYMSATEILDYLAFRNKGLSFKLQKLGRVLKKVGFKKVSLKDGHKKYGVVRLLPHR